MSLFDTFDPDSPEIIFAASHHPPLEGFPETIVMTFQDETFRVLEQLCPTEVVAKHHAGRDIPIYRLNWNGRSIGICQTLLGGPGTAGLLEEALAMGAKKVLLYGSCGVLDSALVAGHFILPTAAYRDEGVSYHYLPVGDYVDIPTAERLGEIFDGLNLPYVKGRVWTTDAFYRETAEKASRRRAAGCVCVDMECSAVAALAQFRGKEVFQFFHGADSLDGERWDRRGLGSEFDLTEKDKIAQLALELAAEIA